MKRLILMISAALLAANAFADEGMWTVNDIDAALVHKLKKAGCTLSPDDIYSSTTASLSNAVVSLNSQCSGALISGKGLLITNHHYAYADLKSISTVDNNYLENGFSAATMDDEVYIPGKHAYVLQEIRDVTAEVNELIKEEQQAGRGTSMRRLAPLMEEKYRNETGFHASLSRMWAGEKYCISLYQDYTDVRLVAAPPVSAAAFGGDKDNWSWPQQKCDFALYRIYASKDGKPSKHSSYNVPLKPARFLTISTKGYTEDSFSMILGYPGHTDRYSCSSQVDRDLNLESPIVSFIRRDEMNIISKWMKKDPAVRLKYADRYFTLANGQELLAGQMECYRDQKILDRIKSREKKYMGSKDGARIVSDMAYKYLCSKNAQRNAIYFRETISKGSRLATIALKLKNDVAGLNMKKEYDAIDMRVENELFHYCVKMYYENVDSLYWGPFQREVREKFRNGKTINYTSLCDYLWKDGIMTREDNIYKFYIDIRKGDFSKDIKAAQGHPDAEELSQEYERMLYRARAAAGDLQYPDANGSLRMTFGKVRPYKSKYGPMSWESMSTEIFEKEDPEVYEYTLKPDWREALVAAGYDGEGEVPVSFITDNDITSGNSGSPVLNEYGEMTGIAYDGNRESLASPVMWSDSSCRAIALDIRFVLWTLRKYFHLDNVLKELDVR